MGGREGGGWQLRGGSSLHSPRVLGIHCTAGYRVQGVEPLDKAPTVSTRHAPITTTHYHSDHTPPSHSPANCVGDGQTVFGSLEVDHVSLGQGK